MKFLLECASPVVIFLLITLLLGVILKSNFIELILYIPVISVILVLIFLFSKL